MTFSSTILALALCTPASGETLMLFTPTVSSASRPHVGEVAPNFRTDDGLVSAIRESTFEGK